MKALARKIKETFASKPAETMAPANHPNFWMYQ